MLLTISILLGLEFIRYLIVENDCNLLVTSALVVALWSICLPLAIIVLVFTIIIIIIIGIS